jgi:tetratricopeptide (TPR) repeat protein
MSYKLLIAFFVFGLSFCKQNSSKHTVDSDAIALNKQAMSLVPFISNADSSQKAISLLDKATAIDTNYFLGYSNKLMFYYELRQFDKALSTNNKLIQLRPTAHDLYLRSGMLYLKISDTTKAKLNFKKGLAICNSVLDTMTKTNRDYVMLTTNQAIALIMLGDTANANKILKVLYDNQQSDSDFDKSEKKYIQSLMNKNSKELVTLLGDQR